MVRIGRHGCVSDVGRIFVTMEVDTMIYYQERGTMAMRSGCTCPDVRYIPGVGADIDKYSAMSR